MRGAKRSTTASALLDSNGNGLSDGLDAKLASLPGNATVDVIVSTTEPGLAMAMQQAVGAFNIKYEYHLVDGFAATVTKGQARALAAQSGVRRVEEDVQVQGFLESSRPDFGVEDLLLSGEPGVNGLTGNGVTVCVPDTGAQGNHEQFIDGGYRGSSSSEISSEGGVRSTVLPFITSRLSMKRPIFRARPMTITVSATAPMCQTSSAATARPNLIPKSITEQTRSMHPRRKAPRLVLTC